MSSGSIKLVTLAAVLLLVAGALALGFYSENRGTVQTSTPDGANYAGGPGPIRVTELGNITTLGQARQIIGVNLSSPTFTPTATTLSQVRAREGVAALVY